MNKVIINRFKLIITLVLLIAFLSGCEVKPNNPTSGTETGQGAISNDDRKVEEVIDLIEVLPDTITLDDLKQIRDIEKLYNGLSDVDKQKVTNYNILAQAIERIIYLQRIDETLYNEFTKIEMVLDEAIPDTIKSLEDKIELLYEYNYTDEVQTVKYRISYDISDINIINALGEVNHPQKEQDVTIEARIKCTYNGYEKSFRKVVRVERNLDYMFDHQILVAYWYGKYQELTDVDYESIDVINYSFAQIAQDESGKWYISGRLDNLKNFAPVKERGIKLCLSLGGWHDDKSFWDTYSLAAKTEESRTAVANAILEVMIKYNLDGVDMDWEYPSSKDRTNFTLLMKKIKETLKAHNKDYLITAAIPSGSWIGSRFDLKSLNECLDFFYIMTYDLDDGMQANHLSSLGDAKEAVEFFKNSGVDASKLVIGSAFYGRKYEGVSDNGKGGLNQTASEKDSLSYDEIKEGYLSRLGGEVKKYYDEANEAYYLYDSKNKQFITYEDIESVTAKWEYVEESGIGGLMYWCYNEDKSNTLMKAINEAQK